MPSSIGLCRWSRAGIVASAVLAAGCAAKGGPDAAAPAAAASDTAIVRSATLQSPHPLIERDVPIKKPREPKAPLVDNLRCYACHATLEDEPLVAFHAGGGVSCEKCHGASKVHTNDEDNLTAPEIMYPPERIAAACWECHPEVKPPKGFQPPVAEDAKKTCTECHFQHRLLRRDRVWDKSTGKLLSKPPVNRMTGERQE